MTTAMPPRPPAPMRPSAPIPPPVTGSAVSIDPVKLVKQYWKLLLACAILGAGLGLGAHFLLLRFAPTFESKVTYQIEPPTFNPLTIEQENTNKDEFDRFMATQMSMMIAPNILNEALKNPDVQETEWAKRFRTGAGLNVNEAVRTLEDDIRARIVPNTQLIELVMTWRDREDVATIVNAVHEAFTRDLRRRGNEDTADRRSALQRRLTDIRDEQARLTQQRERLLTDASVDSLDERMNGATILVYSLTPQLVELSQNIEAAQSQLNEYERQLNNEAGIIYSDAMRAEVEADPMIGRLKAVVTDLQARESALRQQGYLDVHPEIVRIRSQVDATNQEIDATRERLLRARFDAIVDGSRQMLQGMAAQYQGLQAQLMGANRAREDLQRILIRHAELISAGEKLAEEENEVRAAVKDIDTLTNIASFNRVKTLALGQVPDQVVFPIWYVMMPLGMIMLTGLVGGLVLLREILDQRVKGPADVSLAARGQILGVIPDASEDPARPASLETAFRDSPMGVITESYRQLRAPLIKKMQQAGHRSVLILGASPSSGGTSVASNLALGCAAADLRVLLVDANFRRPALHRVFQVAEGPGLGDVLARSVTLDNAIQGTSSENLHVLAAGTPGSRNVPERLSTEAFTEVLKQASQRYDMIIVDTAPAVVAGDGFALANRCDAVALVARAMSDKRGLVSRVLNQLGETRGDTLGVIVNAVRSSAGGYLKGNIRATHEYQLNGKA